MQRIVLSSAPRPSRNAFTLIEIMVVISIIILIIALAVPAMNILKGGRSIDGAINNVNALLGRARAQAIGLQKRVGVMFYYDPATERTRGMLVWDTSASGTFAILDLVPDQDFMELPNGIGLQSIDDSGPIGTPDDHYLGYNTVNGIPGGTPTVNPYGPVILFDGSGKLTATTYGFLCRDSANNLTAMGALLYADAIGIPAGARTNVQATATLRSQRGFVVYDIVLYKSVGRSSDPGGFDDDAEIRGTPSYTTVIPATGRTEAQEEAWLDLNSTPVLINRYNGTTVRGE